MCGVVGIIGRQVDGPELTAMTETLKHRGPDDGGEIIIRNDDLHVGLGHRRLSIIDLSPAGRQPMSNEDQQIWITFNGEIYNYHDIRRELIKKGHIFSSNTDTEVIIHGYEEYGPAILDRLEGMFAFGLWDVKNQQLLLARDRYGKKPLYYRIDKKGVIFASEIKAMLKHPDVKRKIDPQSLSRYLLHEYVPAPYSIFEDIFKLSAGHFLLWTRGKTHIAPYWSMRFVSEDNCQVRDYSEENQEKLLDLFKKSISRRLISDVPLGVFLSGGVDSSAIVALMSEIMPPEKIKTFSIGFGEQSFDESVYARQIADIFHTNHHEKIFHASDMLNILPEVWKFLDEPFADASILPTYMLSLFSREHVTVALGGDGGDEIFAGYDPFLAHRIAPLFKLIPKYISDKIFLPLFNSLPASTRNMSWDFRVKQFLKGVYREPAIRNQIWLGAFSVDDQQPLLHPDISNTLKRFNPYEEILSSCEAINIRDETDLVIFLFCKYYLAEGILTKVDRASMAASLEVRSPFLDREFSEFVHALPSSDKIKGFRRKFIFKKSLAKKLPVNIISRSKKGFGIPLAAWFKNELKPLITDVFDPIKIKREGFFNEKIIQQLLRDHFSGRQDNRKQLWTLLMFEMWKEEYSVSC